jgi:hypothetical protein
LLGVSATVPPERQAGGADAALGAGEFVHPLAKRRRGVAALFGIVDIAELAQMPDFVLDRVDAGLR